MLSVNLRCTYCGTRSQVELDDISSRTLVSEGKVRRYCRECVGNTEWEAVKGQEDRLPQPSGKNLVDTPIDSDVAGRVLLIDDDDAILSVLGTALSREFELETARSARDAIMRITRDDYDVILSDIRMPGFDGKQLFAFLDEHLPEYKDRVVFLTGDVGNKATMDFLDEVGAPYLAKPIEIPVLLSKVRQILEERSHQAESET